MARFVWPAVLLAALLVVAGCAREVSGTAQRGHSAPTAQTLFTATPPTYGLKLKPDDLKFMAYRYALQRIDPCQFALSLKELGAVSLVYGDFGACFVSVKVPGISGRSGVRLSLDIEREAPHTPVFAVGQDATPVYRAADCMFEMPLALDRLPGAPRGASTVIPIVRLSVIDSMDTSVRSCELGQTVAGALAAVKPADLPLRDALNVFPNKLAERDPCELLGEYTGQVRTPWLSRLSEPFTCSFSLADDSTVYRFSFTTGISRQDGLQAETRDGVEYFHGSTHRDRTTSCTSMVQVGQPLRARTLPGGTEDPNWTPDRQYLEVRGSSVRSGDDCETTREMAHKAVKAFRDSLD